MSLKPLPTQVADADFLVSHRHPSLFSEPGTGKTLTALEGYKKVGGRLVIVAPPIALRMWEQNITDHLGAKVQRIKKRSDKLDKTADAYVLSYQMAHGFPDLAGADVLVLDESDALKTLASQRTVAVYGQRSSMTNCLAAGAEHIWPLTGTPIRRYADDLYPQLKALHPKLMRETLEITSLAAFQKVFCVSQMRRFHPRQPMTSVVMGNRNEALLNDFIYKNHLAVRRTIHDVSAHMPPLTIRTITVDYDDNEELREMTAKAAYVGEEDPIMATARRLVGTAKAKHVAIYALDIFDAIKSPILILYWHKDVGTKMEEILRSKGQSVVKIDGATSPDARYKAEQDFNDKKVDFMLGQISSMGVAINLQKGSHYAIFAEQDWSFAAQDQALRRLWRFGQQTHVQVDMCQAEHPIDEAVQSVNTRKEKSANKIINGV